MIFINQLSDSEAENVQIELKSFCIWLGKYIPKDQNSISFLSRKVIRNSNLLPLASSSLGLLKVLFF